MAFVSPWEYYKKQSKAKHQSMDTQSAQNEALEMQAKLSAYENSLKLLTMKDPSVGKLVQENLIESYRASKAKQEDATALHSNTARTRPAQADATIAKYGKQTSEDTLDQKRAQADIENLDTESQIKKKSLGKDLIVADVQEREAELQEKEYSIEESIKTAKLEIEDERSQAALAKMEELAKDKEIGSKFRSVAKMFAMATGVGAIIAGTKLLGRLAQGISRAGSDEKASKRNALAMLEDIEAKVNSKFNTA